MEEVKQELRKRFPLLESLTLKTDSSSVYESLPYFLGLLIASAESPEKKTCCFILPQKDGVAFTLAILLALFKVKEEFLDLLLDYSKTRFHIGEKVRVLPTRHVYEYVGLWPEHNEFFQLKVLGSGDKKSFGERRTFPVTEILRLEPTNLVRPKGKLNTSLGQFELCSLDHLVNISTGGNRSLFKNHFLYLGSKNEFLKIMKTTSLSGTDGHKALLETFFPWGSICENGTFDLTESYQKEGEPILAITPVIDNIAAICSKAEPFSKTIIMDGSERLLKNLQAFDQTSACQKIIIIGCHDAIDHLNILADRECNIWILSPEEILLGDRKYISSENQAFIGKLLRGAQNYRDLKISSERCMDEKIEDAAKILISISDDISKLESEDETKKVARNLFSLLFRAAEYCIPPCDVERQAVLQRINDLTTHLKNRALWIQCR